jgi:seryl-tRNA synthetase
VASWEVDRPLPSNYQVVPFHLNTYRATQRHARASERTLKRSGVTRRPQIGTMPEFGFAIKDHLELGESLGLLDFERAAEVSGAKFYYLKGMGAMLELALVNWAMQKVRSSP